MPQHRRASLFLPREEQVTFSHCVPTILRMLPQAPSGAGLDLSGWKIVIGGSALAPSQCRATMERGIDVFAGYGMSQAGPAVALAQLSVAEEAADFGG